MADPVRLGLIGAGGFGSFVAEAAAGVDDVRLAAVTDPAASRASDLAELHGALAAPDLASMLDAVDAVVVATPPNTHAALSLQALRAGRHVFCEKPMALTVEDAVAVAEAARDAVYVVDHVLRYNPLLAALQRLGDVLGPVRRFGFDNDASDEDLPPGHWFWDPAVSGGIPLEHGVHFFDAAAMLIGSVPTTVTSTAGGRPGGITDTVVSTAVHPDGVLATYAHAFTHRHRAERQHLRLDHGTAEVRVEGWIPLCADLDLWTDDAGLDLLRKLTADPQALFDVPGYRLIGTEHCDWTVPEPGRVRARLDLGFPEAKQQVYAESVRAALRDFAAAIRTGGTPRAGARAGLDAVRVAVAATRSITSGRPEPVPPA
jgi:predicted dehydrogenase